MKRGGENSQLTKEEYDALEEEEAGSGPGVYKKASAEVMATRKIVKRGQKFASFGSKNAAPLSTTNTSTSKPSNVFGSIALTTGKNEPVENPKPSNVFGSISLTAGNSKPVSSFSSSSTTSLSASSTTNTSSVNEPGNKSLDQSKTQKLNSSFLSWVDKQLVDHPVSNWTAGLQDYVKHAQRVAKSEKLKDVPAPPSTQVEASGSSDTISAKTTSSATNGFAMPTNSSAKIGQFSGANEGKEKTSSSFGGFSVPKLDDGSAAEKKNGFTGFGVTPKPSITGFSAPSNLSFMGGSGKGTTGFGSTATSSSATGGTEEYEGEPILEPEKIYKNENDPDKILFETDCKAFRHDVEGKEWKELGKGSLRITQEPGIDKKKVLVRNTLGKVTINAYIYKGMNFKKVGKAGMQFMAVVDASGKPQTFLVKVKPSEIENTLTTFSNAGKEAQ